MLNSAKSVTIAIAAAATITLVGATGASANATSFHLGSEANRLSQTGSMALSASSAASRIVVNGSVKLECTTTTATGTTNTGLYTWPGGLGGTQVIAQFMPAFSSCTGPLGLSFTYACSNPGGGVTTDLAVTNIPTPFTDTVGVEIVNIKCVKTFTGTGCTVNLSGSLQGTYQNPATPTTNGKLTISTAGQNLTFSGSQCPAIMPNGTAQFGAPVGSGTGLANLDYTIGGGALANQSYVTPTT